MERKHCGELHRLNKHIKNLVTDKEEDLSVTLYRRKRVVTCRGTDLVTDRGSSMNHS